MPKTFGEWKFELSSKYKKSKPTIEDAILNYINRLDKDQGKVIIVMGRAGTGKSYLIKNIKEKSNKNCILLAPTGIAAYNINGSTIHSFFQYPHRAFPKEDHLVDKIKDVVRNLDLLIIDEISMVNAAMIDSISNSLKRYKKNNRPFGGISTLFIGDLFQLEPVYNAAVKDKYEEPFFFMAEALHSIIPQKYTLTHSYRHENNDTSENLLDMLDNIRLGKDLDNTLSFLNNKCYDPNFNSKNSSMRLTATNFQAENINKLFLKELPGSTKIFHSKVEGTFKTEKSLPAPNELSLKIGAQVIMTKNNKDLWFNGTIGKIIKFNENSITVKIRNGNLEVTKEVWERIRYKYNEDTKEIEEEVVGSFEQYPMRLGWAVTIHKSQGLTLNDAYIDLGRKAFASGQTYVALSRCRTLEGIKLARPLRKSDIIINPIIHKFYEEFYLRN